MLSLLAKLTSLSMVLAALFACSANRPYQVLPPADVECGNGTDCNGRYYRKYRNYDLGFAEFTERGNAFDTERLNSVLQRVKQHANHEAGVITVVFIHGWLNNASDTNKNLTAFKQVLDRVATSSARLSQRRVTGIFVAWRGNSLDIPGLRLLTFWNRKAVAENLGSGSITQLLLKLDAIHRIGEQRAAVNQNVMVTVGHSFGGAILLTAVKDVLVDRLIDPVAGQRGPRLVDGIGDELFILNPAVEAARALTLVDTAVTRQYNPVQAPVLTVISSDRDRATHRAFPTGQSLGTVLFWNQTDIERRWYRHRITGRQIPIREENLDLITVGNFAPFLTHRLNRVANPRRSPQQCSRFVVRGCSSNPSLCRASGWAKTSVHKHIHPLPDHYPFRFIKTDKSVIADHGDIFGPIVVRLLTVLITDQVAGRRWPVQQHGLSFSGCD